MHLLVTMRPFNLDHSWGSKEVKDWDFVRDTDGNIVVDESHPDWWQDKKNPDRHGIRIPVLDENGVQKVGARNRKQWKRVLTDATGWNNPKNCELWRSEWAGMCNRHLSIDNQIDHRSYERQGKLKIPTIHEGADARKIEEKYLTGQIWNGSWKVEENQMIKKQNALLQKVITTFGKVSGASKKTDINSHPHQLRHYFAEERRKEGWDLNDIRFALGHKKVETTIKYLGENNERLIEATDQYYSNNEDLYQIADFL